MPNVSVNGVSIAYEESGSGFPLVFAHEFAGDLSSWTPQVDHFSRHYRVITYNAVGYRPSDVPADLTLYGQAQQVANLEGLLSHLGIEKAHIVGLSMGAHTVVSFALAHPEMIRSLTAAGVGTGATNVSAFRDDANRRADLLESKGMQGMESYIRGTTRSRFLQLDPVGWQRFADGFMAHSAQGSANTLRGFQARRPSLYALEPELKALMVPTLVITGDEDEPCLEPSLYLKRTIPRAGLLLMPQTGHAVNIERPAQFNAAVEAFLVDVEQGGWPSFDPGSGDVWRL